MVEAAEENTVHSTASRSHPALGLRRRHATGKLSIHHRHVSCLLPFRLSGYDRNRLQGHTLNRVVLRKVQCTRSDEGDPKPRPAEFNRSIPSHLLARLRLRLNATVSRQLVSLVYPMR